jgi:hypothetical protein
VDHFVAFVEASFVVVGLKTDFVVFAVRTVMAHSNLNLPFAVLYSVAADYYHSLPLDYDSVVVTAAEVASLLHLPASVVT